MAEALLRDRLLRDDARRDWQVGSAGTWAASGRPASTDAIEEMAERRIDLRAHRSRAVTSELMEEADLVLAMTQNHVEALKAAFPDEAHKVRLLSRMIGQEHDVLDPYGGTRVQYAHIATELEQLIKSGYERIVALAEGVTERPK